MKNTFRLITVLAVTLVSGLAHAQDAGEGEVETKFYDFNDMLIDGELQRPEGMFSTERGQAQFQSLLNLRRSFIPEIEESAQEEVME